MRAAERVPLQAGEREHVAIAGEIESLGRELAGDIELARQLARCVRRDGHAIAGDGRPGSDRYVDARPGPLARAGELETELLDRARRIVIAEIDELAILVLHD